MNSTASQKIWITGASSGLGRSLALTLAAQGNQVIVSARSRDELEKLAGQSDNITALACDITSVDSVQAAAARIFESCGSLDQVILNAGSCEYLDFPHPDWEALRRVMEINYFGSANCVRAALPLLRQSELARPHLVVIASQVTAAPFARAEAYGASKAALQYFCASLRIDLACENIDVTVVNPGFVDTPLTRKNDFPMPFLMDVDQAAKRIVKNIGSRPRSYSFPRRLSALLLLSKLMPGYWQKSMAPKEPEPNNESKQGTGQ